MSKLYLNKRRKAVIKIEEMNEIENSKTIEGINETKSWFFEKISKFNKVLFRLTKKRWENVQTKIRNENRDITTNFTWMKNITVEY